jgi:hypothetical protein
MLIVDELDEYPHLASFTYSRVAARIRACPFFAVEFCAGSIPGER